MSGIVDWGIGERAAGAVIAGVPGRGAQRAADPYTAAEVELACERAIQPKHRQRLPDGDKRHRIGKCAIVQLPQIAHDHDLNGKVYYHRH